MESNAAGMVWRLALKTRFSDKGMGFDSSAFRQILTFELTQATEEVRDLWQVRVEEIYFGIPKKFTLVFR